MTVNSGLAIAFLVPVLLSAVLQAQRGTRTSVPESEAVSLDVVVTDKSGPPVSGLPQEDFIILDNGVPQTITSFEAVAEQQTPIEVVLLLDTLKVDPKGADVALEGINNFLMAREGQLAYPTRVAILTGTKIQYPQDFSQNGNEISADLAHRMAVRSVSDSEGYSPPARFQISLQSLRYLVEHEVGRPGRKFIIWVSPGWTQFSGSQRMQSAIQEQQFFDSIVDISTQLREFQITLYSVDPLGMADIGSRRANWELYLKGVTKPSEVRRADLTLPVIATHSGGLALTSTNNIAEQIRKCLADADAYYKIAFEPAISDNQNEYHQLVVVSQIPF